ncbi:MAG: Cof-type HAD-IIB family hydrolase [Lachnospiraceae bacterium]|nr:Cof-type HAD-IIB family hydrolase [Lachnospiraceae bacterium]
MGRIKLISLDLDGTLLDSRRRLSERNRSALQRAKEHGMIIVISTGSPYQLIPFKLFYGIEIDYAITANGGALYDYQSGCCIFEETIPYTVANDVMSFLAKHDVHTDYFVDGKGYTPRKCKEIIEKLRVPESRKVYLQSNRTWVDNMNEIVTEHSNQIQKITINFYQDSNGQLVEYEEVKNWFVRKKELNMTTGVKDNLEITRSNVDKGMALDRLSDILNIDMESIMAFGDSLNDLSVIEKAGIGIAMGNSMEDIFCKADIIAGTNDEDGVAIEIEKILP